jgi:type II secretory pathway pseudopilin PulG
MLRVRRLRRRAGDARGFTLIETLVAMVTGVLVLGVLFATLEVAFRQSARISDVAEATQLGRTAMTHIIDETHSACLSSGFTPVQEKSSEKEFIFINAYSESAEIPNARKDKIVWNEAAKTLTDYTYASNGGTWPKFTFSETATPAAGVRIGEKISQVEPKSGEKVPIFQYYAYATKSSTSPTAPSTTLEETPLTVPLSTATAETAASVLISFRTSPTNGKGELGKGVDQKTQATFAFTAPSSEAPIDGAPCE